MEESIVFLRVSNPVATPFDLNDLGIQIAASASNIVLSDQFTVNELVRSKDLEDAVINSDLTIQLDYGTGYTTVSAADYTNRDALGTFLNVYEITNENNNEDLVDGSEVNSSGPASAPLHIHDARYYTETELGGTGGAQLIGADDTSSTYTYTTVQEALDAIEGGVSAVDLDGAYTNDSDGILNVNGTTKNLNFRSNNVNDVAITRFNITQQDFLRADVSADELLLGSLLDANNPQVDVRVKSDLYVDGNITFVGEITDTTVNEMNVTNANILLREGSATGADASYQVERGSTGADAALKWDETADRWKAGLEGSEQTIALLEADETVSGVWNFGGDDDTEPNFWLTEKDPSTPPASNLGSAGQIPMGMMEDGILAVYDKSNSRDKWLSVQREFSVFTGRNTGTVKNEYLWVGRINSAQTGLRALRDMTLIGMSAEVKDASTFNIRVRKNNNVANLATLAVTTATGKSQNDYNIDFDAGDEIQVYTDSSSNLKAPVIKLEFAYKY